MTRHNYGVHGIDVEDLCKAVLCDLDNGSGVLERSRVMEMIIDSVGRDKAFTRLYHDHGPVVLTENFLADNQCYPSL